MSRRRHTPEQIITALREAEVGLAISWLSRAPLASELLVEPLLGCSAQGECRRG